MEGRNIDDKKTKLEEIVLDNEDTSVMDDFLKEISPERPSAQ